MERGLALIVPLDFKPLPHLGHDQMFEATLREQDRLGRLLKEIDRGRGVGAEGLRRELELELLRRGLSPIPITTDRRLAAMLQ